MDFLTDGGFLNILGSVGLLFAGFIARRYIIPFLQIGKRQRYAELIAHLADEITDELRLKYPNREWLKHLDEGIDRLAALLGISPDIARRAINAATSRK